jgi:murein DD-endopeptidase MepM/ murein hydrolase activator NlpD
MIRLLLAATAAVMAGTTVAGAAGTIQASHAVLSPAVALDLHDVSIDDAPDHTAIVHAPTGTPILAVSAGTPFPAATGAAVGAPRVDIHGAGEDAGLDVDYAGLADATAAPTLERGATLGAAPTAPAVVAIRATLDGRPLDTATLLRAAQHGGGADVVGNWIRPVDGAVVTQPFGCTSYAMEPIDRSCPSGHIHTGIDLAAPFGTPVRAALDGIAHVTVSATGYGLHVALDDGDGLSTLYAHLSAVDVHDGDDVSAGDVIGEVGSTGNSTGPHLHFEVRRDGIAEDPTLDVALP